MGDTFNPYQLSDAEWRRRVHPKMGTWQLIAAEIETRLRSCENVPRSDTLKILGGRLRMSAVDALWALRESPASNDESTSKLVEITTRHLIDLLADSNHVAITSTDQHFAIEFRTWSDALKALF